MLAHGPHIRHAMGDRDPGVYGAVILASDVAVGDRTSAVFDLVPELRALRNGSAVAVAPLDAMRELASRLHDPRAVAVLSEPVTPGYVWTMVVMPRALAVAPLGRPEARDPAQLDASGLATFLRRWPETAHLAARLDPKPGARRKVTFDLGVTIGALEEFVQIIDALAVAHPDMRADADKARGALPSLRAKLRQAAN
jgi:hypothetical protein